MPTLLIRKGEENWLYVTATELSTSENPYYKFVFSQDQQKKKKEVVLLDVSNYKQSYNEFKLIEGTDVTFDHTGEYEYRIFDSNNVQVEIGKAIVQKDETKSYAPNYKNENNFIPS